MERNEPQPDAAPDCETRRREPELRATVEALVRQTLARLNNEQNTERLKTDRSTNQTRAGASPAGAELAIPDRLITLATLAGKLAGARAVVVRPGAVVTPAAKELLWDKKIELIVGSPDPAACPRRRQACGLILAVAGASYDPAPLAAALVREGATIEIMNRPDPITTLEALADALRNPPGLAMLFTGEPAAAACLANRRPELRAAVAGSPAEATAAIDSLGANLLVADPAKRTYWELLRIARHFVARGPQPCPSRWREPLQ